MQQISDFNMVLLKRILLLLLLLLRSRPVVPQNLVVVLIVVHTVVISIPPTTTTTFTITIILFNVVTPPLTTCFTRSEFIRILFLQAHRETDRFFADSGVLSAQSDRGFFHYHRAAFSSILKSRVGNILVKSVFID
jgi:hypothetical protein